MNTLTDYLRVHHFTPTQYTELTKPAQEALLRAYREGRSVTLHELRRSPAEAEQDALAEIVTLGQREALISGDDFDKWLMPMIGPPCAAGCGRLVVKEGATCWSCRTEQTQAIISGLKDAAPALFKRDKDPGKQACDAYRMGLAAGFDDGPALIKSGPTPEYNEWQEDVKRHGIDWVFVGVFVLCMVVGWGLTLGGWLR